MRIALLSQEYPPETAKGGLGTQTYLKAHGLLSLGHEVCVISRCAKDAPKIRSERDDRGVRVIRIPGFEAHMGVYTAPADWVTYSAAVAAEIAGLNERWPIDVVEFPEWAAEGYVHLLNQTEWNRISTVVQLHGPLVMFAHAMGWPDLNSQFYRTGSEMERTCLRLANAVYSSSRCSAEWCAGHYGLDRAEIPVLHAGVDTYLFSPCAVLKAERPTVVFAGKLVPNKGVVTLVEAACRLVREIPNLRVHLLGRAEPAMMTHLRQLAAAAEAPELIEHGGFVAREQLPEHISRAHVFALPSPYEPGPGLVYLEAMACAVPVIGCATAGAQEVIMDGQTGLLVPPNDPAALAAALHELLANRARREQFGEAARRFVLSHATAARCVERIAAFYRQVIARTARRERPSLSRV